MKKSKSFLKHSRYFIFFVALFCLIQCKFVGSIFDKKDEFSPYQHPVFTEGDTLTFISENRIDSLYVNSSKIAGADEWGDTRDFMLYESFWEPLGCTDSFCVKYRISIGPTIYNWTYTYNELRYEAGNIMSSSMFEDSFDLESIIHGVELLDLYEIDFVRNVYNKNHKEIVSALYSKSLGFVQYTKHTGEVFTISQESLEMLMAREWPVPQ